jgi:hypothetical protein
MRMPAGVLLLAWAVYGIAAPAAAAKLVVSNATEIVNGDTSNPAALKASPGPDGISLREAMFAANGAPGPHTITFAPAMAGQTIVLVSGHLVRRERTSIIGLVDGDGQPTVALDASQLAPNEVIVFFVTVSDFTIESLRFLGLHVSHKKFGVFVRAGAVFGEPGNQGVKNIQIRGNVFEADPAALTGSIAISAGMESGAVDAVLANVTIAGNTVRHFRGDANGIIVGASGSNSLIKDVTIAGNRFSDTEFPVELVAAAATNSRIIRSQIVGNTFDDSLQPVNLNHFGPGPMPVEPASNNLIDDTLIAGNVFRGNRGPAIVLLGGMNQATANTIRNTRIINNLMVGATLFGGVGITGGRGGGTGNLIKGVSIINNTIVDSVGNAVGVNANLDGGSGNTVTNVSVRNTISWNNGQGEPELWGLTPNDVSYSVIEQAGFAGVNHNRSFNPRFVNPDAGDYHLRPNSRAIGTGTARKAPTADLDCQPRNAQPSIGAYEGSGPDICPAE